MLYQTSSYGVADRLIVADARLDSLARTAETQAGQLDDRQVLAREIARQKKERHDNRVAAAKAPSGKRGHVSPIARVRLLFLSQVVRCVRVVLSRDSALTGGTTNWEWVRVPPCSD